MTHVRPTEMPNAARIRRDGIVVGVIVVAAIALCLFAQGAIYRWRGLTDAVLAANLSAFGILASASVAAYLRTNAKAMLGWIALGGATWYVVGVLENLASNARQHGTFSLPTWHFGESGGPLFFGEQVLFGFLCATSGGCALLSLDGTSRGKRAWTLIAIGAAGSVTALIVRRGWWVF